VNTTQTKYYKDVALPVKVKVKEAKSTYKNGVLEVVFPKADVPKEPQGEPIDVD
jgi:HSP20 family molecular chaperone IbpA